MNTTTGVQTWTRLSAFHIALIPMGRIWILSPSSCKQTIGQTAFFYLGKVTNLGEGGFWIQNVLNSTLKLNLYWILLPRRDWFNTFVTLFLIILSGYMNDMPKWCLVSIYMEIRTATQSEITLFDKVSFKLQKT